ncbi:MAG: hypothetical protein KatS3mg087_0117 [Patescibacteria group bacterium]|nr:MAG: hypothetical protein KatS3mg087_0117 [Patescibacteria group bacterium]
MRQEDINLEILRRLEVMSNSLQQLEADYRHLRNDVDLIRKVIYGNGNPAEGLIGIQIERRVNYRWLAVLAGAISLVVSAIANLFAGRF